MTRQRLRSRYLLPLLIGIAIWSCPGCEVGGSEYDVRYAPDDSGYQKESDLTLGPACAWGGPVIEGIIGTAAAIAFILGSIFRPH